MNELASRRDEGEVTIRRATAADVDALTSFGARTFFEAFARDNTPEDMKLHLEKAWRRELQAAEIADPAFDTLLACDTQGAFAGFAQLRAGRAPPARRARARPRPPAAQASVARPATIVVFGSRRNSSGEVRIFVERLPPPRISQSSAMTRSST